LFRTDRAHAAAGKRVDVPVTVDEIWDFIAHGITKTDGSPILPVSAILGRVAVFAGD
jgi:hypothetical protein